MFRPLTFHSDDRPSLETSVSLVCSCKIGNVTLMMLQVAMNPLSIALQMILQIIS